MARRGACFGAASRRETRPGGRIIFLIAHDDFATPRSGFRLDC